jgi:hypothetical protein
MIKLLSSTKPEGVFKPLNKAQQEKYPMPPFIIDNKSLPLIYDGEYAEILICGGMNESILVMAISNTKTPNNRTVSYYRDDFMNVDTAINFANELVVIADIGSEKDFVRVHKMTKRVY